MSSPLNQIYTYCVKYSVWKIKHMSCEICIIHRKENQIWYAKGENKLNNKIRKYVELTDNFASICHNCLFKCIF